MKAATVAIVLLAAGLFTVFQFYGQQTMADELMEGLPLSRAAYEGRRDAVADLLKRGGNPNERDRDGNTPLHRATELSAHQQFPDGNHEACTQLLLAAGGNPKSVNSSDETPLYRAVWSPRLAGLLIEAGADPNRGAGPRSALMSAAYLGGPLCGDAILTMRRLLAAGADVNAQEAGGFSALTTAGIYGCPDMVRVLLAAGADPNARTVSGESLMEMLKRYETIADDGIFTRAGRDERIENARLIRAAGGR